jgi:hypothetical protein
MQTVPPAAATKQYKDVIKKAIPGEDTKDTNYIFFAL